MTMYLGGRGQTEVLAPVYRYGRFRKDVYCRVSGRADFIVDLYRIQAIFTTTITMDSTDALDQLTAPTTLSILALSRPILHPASASKRTSSGSASSDHDALRTPSVIQADLIHYQELFSKLRFSYVEQVTKERFLRAVTAEVPEFVSGGENAELEEKLRGDKEALRTKKEEVRGLIAVLEEQGRGLAGRKS